MTEPRPSLAREIARLRRLTVAELVPEYERLFGKPPRSKHRDWLWRRCAWKLQERELGGLSMTAKRKLDELIAEIDLPLGEGRRTAVDRASAGLRRRATDPPIGTILTKRWRDHDLRLLVTEEGFEVDGVLHPSLSAAAKAVTGAKWNGRLFWLGRSRSTRT